MLSSSLPPFQTIFYILLKTETIILETHNLTFDEFYFVQSKTSLFGKVNTKQRYLIQRIFFFFVNIIRKGINISYKLVFLSHFICLCEMVL